MPRVIDLSHAITHGMAVFPADPAVGVLTHHNYGNGYYVSQLIMGTHTGTHVDAPVHKLPGTKTLTDLGVESYIGFRTAVLDVTGIASEITAEVLSRFAGRLDGCDAAILRSGWSSKWGTEAFFNDFPGLNEDAAAFFQKAGIRLIGLETPSVNAARHQEVHVALLEREIAVAESLANVGEIRADYVEFYAVPLKLEGLDGSPVRAFAVER